MCIYEMKYMKWNEWNEVYIISIYIYWNEVYEIYGISIFVYLYIYIYQVWYRNWVYRNWKYEYRNMVLVSDVSSI